MRNGGELIVEYLVREQVPYVFGVCGHGNVGLLDALYDRADAIRTISTRHEQTAGHMADAYFRVAHRPAATLTSCGPGSCNIPIALACAFMDSSAFLAITANVPTSQFNRAPFQETYRHFQAGELHVTAARLLRAVVSFRALLTRAPHVSYIPLARSYQMAVWVILLSVCAAGLIGGLLNAFFAHEGFVLWRLERLPDGRRIWRPGFLGNMLVDEWTRTERG